MTEISTEGTNLVNKGTKSAVVKNLYKLSTFNKNGFVY